MSSQLDELLAAVTASDSPSAALSALSALDAELLPSAPATADDSLFDEKSFEIFDAALHHAPSSAACLQASQRLMLALAERASAREVFTMVMEALTSQRPPAVQLLLLRTLARVLPRLQRKRADFVATCVGSLIARYLDGEWPGMSWDNESDADDDDDPNAADADVADGPRLSDQLLPALLDCVAPLGAEVGEVAATAASVEQKAASTARRVVLGFLWRSLELLQGVAGGVDSAQLRSRVVGSIRAAAPRVDELEEAVALVSRVEDAAAPLAASVEAVDLSEGGEGGEGGESQAAWPLLGMAIYVSDELTPGEAPAAGEVASGGAQTLATSIDQLPSTRRLALLCPLAACLLRGAHGRIGHALLSRACRGVADGSLGPTSHDRASGAMEGAVRALLGHMAGSSEQAERTAAYATLRQLLWLWEARARLTLITALVGSCPFPNVVALLVHRLKEEHLAEEKPKVEEAAGEAAGSGAGVFGAGALLGVVEPLLVVPSGGRPADPLDSLDAWMAALNLIRLLLNRARPQEPSGAALPSTFRALPETRVAELRRLRLEPLDRWVRTSMDALWADIVKAEASGTSPDALDEMRMSFTHLHVAADVAARTVECATW